MGAEKAEKKYGVYLCSGCGIGEAIDMEALAKIATDEFKHENTKTHPFLCSKEGVDMIKADIANEGVNTVVIAGCSHRAKHEEFRLGPEVIMDRVNLREQVVWTHKPEDEDSLMMAEDLLRMSLTKVKLSELPTPWQVENLSKDVLVVGGGVAGMTAAVAAAKAGYKAILVEKEAALGGYVGKMYKVAGPPYEELLDNPVPALAAEIKDNPNIKVYTGATVESIAGGPGTFDVKIKTGGGTADERAGAVILATGSVPYDPAKLPGHLGYGTSPKVITQADFEKLAADGKLKDVDKIGFIQCAGSRREEHLPYCSAACCVESLKQSCYLTEQNPDGQAYVFYEDIRAVGKYEYLYLQAQKNGTVFIKGDLDALAVKAEGDQLTVEIDDLILGERVAVEGLDYVVLANGMVPTSSFGKVYGADEAEEEEDAAEEEETVTADEILVSNLLNLDYRQGPELPNLKYGFPDSHFVCFPYESRRTGIYPVGTVRNPMHVEAAIEDATGGVLKAIQCIEACAVGKAVHPRSGDLSYPDFFMQRCTQCKRCTEECPFGAINEDEKGNPLPERTRCRRCGTCMGACPERIISFTDYSVSMISNMLKAIEVPDEEDEKPRILVFACENDAIPALDMVGLTRLQYNAWVRVIPVRCLGSLALVWVSDAMSGGFDGVLLLGCKHGDDYQCHFMKGSELAEIRLSKISETLDRLGLESERVMFKAITIMDHLQIPKILDEFAEKLDEIGPNPMKGF